MDAAWSIAAGVISNVVVNAEPALAFGYKSEASEGLKIGCDNSRRGGDGDALGGGRQVTKQGDVAVVLLVVFLLLPASRLEPRDGSGDREIKRDGRTKML